MSEQIQLIKKIEENDGLTDTELVQRLYSYLKDRLRLSKRKAFNVIYFLQELVPVFPDQIEQCSICGDIYDSYNSGHYSEFTNKYYCSYLCEPDGLYEKEQLWEEKKDAPFRKWEKKVLKEQVKHSCLTGKTIGESTLRKFFHRGETPQGTIEKILKLIKR